MTNFWVDRRVVVTGAAGFVGANLCRTLMDTGADVVGLDLIKTSPGLHALNLPCLLMLCRDIRSADRLPWVLANGNGELGWRLPEVVFHLAAVGHISQAQKNPMTAWQVNVQGTWNILEACRVLPAGQLKAVVLASSNHVFGSLNPGAVPAVGPPYAAVRQDSARAAWLEDDPCGASDVYGISKGMVDLLAKAYAGLGLPVAALRHVNCFGPADPFRSHIVTGTICDLLEGKAPVIRGDGTAIKGYVHVRDAVSAYLILGQALAEGRAEPGVAYNAGASAPISVLALVDTLIQLCGSDAVPEILGEDFSQLGYVEHLLSGRLEALGWEAGNLHEDLARTVAWYRDHGGMAWLAS